ncbi:hypothetical protein ABZV91_02680 [Nocardia sp. NPDC004568]|uniref:hypothetical protein n=1 Tax=Nocardia sp. NPDC004568 TaxID=3154551 RepID=UPI0033B45A65
MSEFRNNQPQYTAHKTWDALTRRGITMPAQVTEAMDLLTYVESVKPRNDVDHAPIAEAYLNREPAEQIAQKAAVMYAAGLQFSAWSNARDRAARGVLEALRFNHDELVAGMAELAAPLIEAIEHVARLDTHSVDALVVAGRNDDARILAELQTTVAELKALYELRRVTTPPGFRYASGAIDCGEWQDPRKVTHASGANPHSYYVHGVQLGGRLWFPTVGEAESTARNIRAAVEHDRQTEEAAGFTERVRRFGAAHA